MNSGRRQSGPPLSQFSLWRCRWNRAACASWTRAEKNTAAVDEIASSADRLDSAIGQELASVATCDFPGKVVRLAKADHVIWKRRLFAAGDHEAALAEIAKVETASDAVLSGLDALLRG